MPPSILELADMRNGASLASKMRQMRFAFFEKLLGQVPRPLSICDIGGTADFWRGFDDHDAQITVVNVGEQPDLGGRLRVVVGDARSLPFGSRSFDVVFSNSVIEHVGTLADQQRMADEVRRIGKRHFVQTPSYYFPLEPHFLVPGFQYLPVNARAWMLTRQRLGWVPREKNFADAKQVVESIRLLRLSEFRRLFPDSDIFEERVLGITKSFVAYGGW